MEPATEERQPERPGEGLTGHQSLEKGAVLTATELEGCAPAADWSRWIRDGSAPAPGPEASFADSWREDLAQLADLGMTSVQVTLEWARLEPRPGEHDQEAIEFRRELLAATRALGMTTWACLVDGTLPGWFSDDEGGFLDDRSRSISWPRHVDWIGEHFADLVDGWIPQREPITWALRRYLRAEAPPGRRDRRQAGRAVQAAVLADGEAWRLLRGTAPVAMFQTARPVRAEAAAVGGDNLKARPLAQDLERLLWHPWLSALTDGILVVGDLPPRQVEHLQGAFDRVVVELRPMIEVGPTGRWKIAAPQPESMAEMLRRVAGELGSQEIVGAGSLAGVVDDGRTRPDHIQAVLDLTTEAAAETSVVGWWQSSPFDAYHWEHGASIRPGVIAVDRTETDSARSLRDHGR